MDPINFAASVAALIGVLSKTISYLSAVKDASTERKALSQEAAGLLSVLISLQNKVEDHESLESCSEGIRILATEYGPLDQLREALKQLAQRLKPQKKGIKKFAGTLIWPFDKKQCEEMLKKVERVKSRINLALQGDIYKLVHEIKADTAGIDLVKEHMSDLHIRENMRERNDILTWFSPLNFFQSQQDKFGRRAKDTGQWLIDAPRFQNWIAGSNSGVGKSILASVVVDYLRNVFVATYSYGVAAAYCNFKERDIQSPENLLAGLCVQVIDGSKTVPEILVQLHKSHASKRTRPTLEDVLDVLKEVVKHFKTTYLIVDALDECPSEVRDILLQKLKALQPMIRLLVTTRPTIDQFAENATIEIRASHGDQEKYIHSRVASGSRLSSLLQRRTRLLSEVCNKVIDKASGMSAMWPCLGQNSFLAATLHMDSLATKMSVETLKRAIENLPSTLNQLYDDAFRRIDDQDKEERGFANKALRWVAYAYRPLTVRELEEALAIEPRGQDFNPDAAPNIAFVLEACAGLLIVDKETEQVRLVHYTAQDYLDTLLTSRYREAHASIAGECITYLSYDVFQRRQQFNAKSDHEPDDEPDDEPDADDESDDECLVKARNGKKQLAYCLLAYALDFWAKHYRIAVQGIKLVAQLYGFLASNPRIWLRTGPYDEPPRSPAHFVTINGIGIAAYHGLHDALRRLLQQNRVDIDRKTYYDHSALHLAAMNDEVVSIEILLEYGADIECLGEYKKTPLLSAIEWHSIKAAWLLVERGAYAMAVDEFKDEPFARVSWASPIPFLLLLLNYGAEVNARTYDDGTQLMLRAMEDDVETARWLLEKGAAVDLRDDVGRTALFHAAKRASVDMVGLLLGHGADSSISDRDGNTILHAACNGGKVAVLRQFLNLGIDIDATNYRGQTPLHIAALEEHSECLELLLANNADVDKKDDDGRTPLMAAVFWRSSKVCHSLLDAGAKVDLQDRKGCSALHLAVAESNISTVRLLLKRHANCAERSSLDLSLKHTKSYIVLGSTPVLAGSDGQITFLNAQASLNSAPVHGLKCLLFKREEVLECRLWEGGMTALDIAVVRNDAECISLLEPLTGSRTESTTMSFADYMCELFGCSSVAELEEEFERRDEEE
ncbi:MAG: hypothetical protein LQ338_004901 [Usnochroma carphineum]|nr:MAG: hypothetical protein LQ338_004901 [Usnochroma carphineum]